MFVVFPPSIAILGLFDTRKKYKIGYQRKNISESTKVCQRLFWKKILFKNISKCTLKILT